MITVLFNGFIFDGFNEELCEGGAVVVEDNKIVEVCDREPHFKDARRIDCQGQFLMPGLIDCHFHAYTPSLDLQGLDRMPTSLLSQHAGKLLEAALLRGFTTVRDAGGGDVGLALAVEKGLIQGPRFFFSGKAISQTGGHGDLRRPHEIEPCGCGYTGVITQIADGVDGMRLAVREELRKGATQIKLFVSGGVLSPADPIWMPQFSNEEIRTAVEEAASRRTYVMAHCHTDDRALVCAEQGVRSIEHGTEISAPTAEVLARKQVYVVPTMSIAATLRDHANQLGLRPEDEATLGDLYEKMQQSIENCTRAGVKLGLGTDLIGGFHARQNDEFQLRREVNSPIEILRSATSLNAEIVQQQGKLGCIASGAWAVTVHSEAFYSIR